MKAAVAIVLLVVATAYGRVPALETSITNYHDKVGIPRLASIKAYEEQLQKEDAIGERIVGGSVGDIMQFPYQAGLIITLTDWRQSVCGGSLIATTRVLTAAHCQFDGSLTGLYFNVVLGSSTLFTGGTRLITSDVAVHPQWNPRTTENDIAVIRFPAITFTVIMQPIDLPGSNYVDANLVGNVGTASGFGQTHDGAGIGPNQRLSWVNLPILNNAACAAAYGSAVVHDTHICTSGDGGRNICAGDSGGPLVIPSGNRRILIGVASFGAQAGCMAGLPSAFTRVPSYLPWILST